ncbi:hypothetical protein MB901379_02844 [Mycobacterium basiliense]|uniref:Transmembrane protein n=1 Tax=Mycobacterium basiliense TaxID=2094119 RepID=A0A447GFK5_9MYCO|nr:DUF5631 domain-containing protein [Mycobacterium basiliense]VDM89271.1 hypothetical protein MB901379_02844 [Mycobacterium basiliense]
MAADLPPGKWSAWLVGAWWPARPNALTSGVSYWRQAEEIKHNEANGLQNERSRLAVNRGRTADDLMDRFLRGEHRLNTIAEQCDTKSRQSDLVADAVDNLRDQLTNIAQSGNGDIDQILSGEGPIGAKVAAVNAVIAQANTAASSAGATAMSNIIDATQRVLDATIGGNARTWLQEHGANLDGPPPSRPITARDLETPPMTPLEGSAIGGAPMDATAPESTAPEAPTASMVGRASVVPAGPSDVAPAPAPPGASTVGRVPIVPGPSPSGPTGPPSPPGAPPPGLTSPPIPGAPAPSAVSAPGLSPQSLAQSFNTGMSTGAPAAAGAQSLSAGAMAAAGEPPPPTMAPPAAPVVPASTIAASGAGFAHVPDAGVGAAATGPTPIAAPTPDVTGGVTPVTPVMTGAPATGSVAPMVGAPAGPLPAYGSDLRPPIVAPPAASAAPGGPVSGAAVAPSPSSSPSAGGSLMSPVAKSAAQGAAQGQATSGAPAMASATAAATTGGAAGDAASRSAEQQRLRRIVEAVARQEPGLTWAAGLRADGQTTLLVTDLAGGWIPPDIRLPAHVTLLEPAARRRDASVLDLLGAVSTAAVHQPHGYIGEAGNDQPKLTGDRAARTAPEVDELGPTLAEHVRHRDGLPRVAQAVAVAAARSYGVPENEAELLSERAAEIRRSVLAAYPNQDLAQTTDWMLLAAINALIDGNHAGANYHLAWAMAAMSMRRPT